MTGFHSQYSGIGEKWGHPASPDCQKPKADSVLHVHVEPEQDRVILRQEERSSGSEGLLFCKGAWPRQRSRGSEGLLSCRPFCVVETDI